MEFAQKFWMRIPHYSEKAYYENDVATNDTTGKEQCYISGKWFEACDETYFIHVIDGGENITSEENYSQTCTKEESNGDMGFFAICDEGDDGIQGIRV
jgi:hypothetical protein